MVHSFPTRRSSDLAGVGQLFARATVHIQGKPDPVVEDPAQITAMFADFLQLYDGVPRTRHLIVNLIVEPVSASEARATSTVLVVQQTPSLPLQPIITGDYADRFVKSDGQWHFAERVITNDLFGDLSAHGKYAYSPA